MFAKLIHRLGSSWYVWIFPLLAVALSAWLFFDYVSKQGPRIVIQLDDASGIEADKTTVRYHGVAIGSVKDVRLGPDNDAEIEVLLSKEGERFAVAESKFALMKPKASFEGITGLETVLEGLYLEALPGPEGGKKTLHFKAQKIPLMHEEETTAYFIDADDGESISSGDAVTYRGVRIGSVSSKTISRTGQRVAIRFNIDNGRVGLIRDNTQLWRKVGIQGKFGLFGAKIKMNSLESIVAGGLQIATPDPAGPKAKAGKTFQLQKDPPKDYEKWAPAL